VAQCASLTGISGQYVGLRLQFSGASSIIRKPAVIGVEHQRPEVDRRGQMLESRQHLLCALLEGEAICGRKSAVAEKTPFSHPHGFVGPERGHILLQCVGSPFAIEVRAVTINVVLGVVEVVEAVHVAQSGDSGRRTAPRCGLEPLVLDGRMPHTKTLRCGVAYD
jgi:hypothetical protein